MQNSSPLKQISTILLGVTSVDASLPFYRDTLGLEVAMSFPGFAFLNAGSVTLGLSEELAKHFKSPPGAQEIVFAVDDVTAAHSELTRRGVTFTKQPCAVTPNEWGANFDDPDGHHLAIFGPRGGEGD